MAGERRREERIQVVYIQSVLVRVRRESEEEKQKVLTTVVGTYTTKSNN